MKPFALTPLLTVTLLLAGCASQERLDLPIKLPLIQTAQTLDVIWHDERPSTDKKMLEVPTAAGYLVTLGDDIAVPSVVTYLRNQVGVDGGTWLAGKSIRIKRLQVSTEARNSWIASSTRAPIVALAAWEQKQMPTEYRSRVEAYVLLDIDGESFEGKSLIPFEGNPSSLDIANAVKIAVANLTRDLARRKKL